MLFIEAFSAQRHVSFYSSYQLKGLILGGSEGEVSILIAQLADRGKFLDLFRLGNQLQDVLEPGPEEGPV